MSLSVWDRIPQKLIVCQLSTFMPQAVSVPWDLSSISGLGSGGQVKVKSPSSLVP
jgi:hypothetical protein